ncbi:MAG: hypothetical protein JKY01_10035 [Pseudomonadales bacterium]|nr:hypothetical protein [Pseudomonadales bacterium]
MSYSIQDYPVKPALEKISRHDKLPKGAVELGRCFDATDGKMLYVLVKRREYLSILVSWEHPVTHKYSCKQFDFPLKVLSWFPKALEDFRKPPAEGGLHAGGMTSADEAVDGEMHCVQSGTEGYFLVNRSRQSPLGFDDSYSPTDLALSYVLLYDLGFLALFETLGEKYERGEL